MTGVVRAATPRRILVAGWLLFVVYAFPGYLSYDPVLQLAQARHLAPYTDWHPPLMAMIWRVTDHVIAGPFPMLVLQSTLFLAGLYHLARRAMSERAAAVVAVCILLFPPVLSVMAVIWKDSQMAGYFLAGTAGLLAERRRWRIAGYVLLSLATGMRQNAMFATVPLLAFFALPGLLPQWKRLAAAAALWVVVTGAALEVNALAADKHEAPFEASLALLDVANTLGDVKGLTDEQILARYGDLPWSHRDKLRIRLHMYTNPRQTALYMTEDDSAAQLFTLPMSEAQARAARSAWLDVIERYPLQYLRERASIFLEVLDVHGYDDEMLCTDFTNAAWAEDLISHRARHAELQSAWIAVMHWLTPMFRPWIYLLLALAFVPLAWRRRDVLAILLSGLAYELALFFVSPSHDNRYSHWMITCTVLAGAMLFAIRRTARKPAPAPAPAPAHAPEPA